jgi:hypothetical protein
VGDEPLQEWRTAFQAGDDFGCIRTGERHHKYGRVTQIGAEPYFRNGYTCIP